MSITIDFINRNTNAEQILVYRSPTTFTETNLPSVYDSISGDATTYTDNAVERGQEFYYMLCAVRGSDRAYSSILHAYALPINTGPGPQTLIGGDSRAGYYGTISAADFITGDDLARAIGLTAGTAQNSDVDWMKFAYQGETYFIPKKSHRYNISWSHINAANAIDGSKIITIGVDEFHVELMKGLNPDPSVPFTTGYDVPSGYNSMWNELMYKVAVDIPTYPKTSQVGPNWANFPQDDSADGLNITAGNGRYSWCQEVAPNNSANRVLRGTLSVTYLYAFSASSTSSDLGWRSALRVRRV